MATSGQRHDVSDLFYSAEEQGELFAVPESSSLMSSRPLHTASSGRASPQIIQCRLDYGSTLQGLPDY